MSTIIIGVASAVATLLVVALYLFYRRIKHGCGNHHYGEWSPLKPERIKIEYYDGGKWRIRRYEQRVCQHEMCRVAEKEWRRVGHMNGEEMAEFADEFIR